MTRKCTINENMSELARSGKGVYILAVSVEGNWNESMHHKEYIRRDHSQFSITYDLHGASENGHFCNQLFNQRNYNL